jgi:hypothetical protein
MRVVVAPGTHHRSAATIEFRKLRFPISNDAFVNQWLQECLEGIAASREELRAVIKLEVPHVARCHAAAGAAGFFEDSDICVRLQVPSDNQAGKPGSDDSDPGHHDGFLL